MRIFTNVLEAVIEVERDLWEMGIKVHPQTMQDKYVADNPDYETREVQSYGFKVTDCPWNRADEAEVVSYLMKPKRAATTEDAQRLYNVLNYINAEFNDRVSGIAMNPGKAWQYRKEVWNEFMHDGQFSYTYSERIAPQLTRIMEELRNRPDTRQAIINIHSNIQPSFAKQTMYHSDRPEAYIVGKSADLHNMGGQGRIPCSLHYQLMRRKGKLDLTYCMRSCDFLTHFPVDIMLAMRLQNWAAASLSDAVGTFTYFTGSLHAYAKDMKDRGIY